MNSNRTEHRLSEFLLYERILYIAAIALTEIHLQFTIYRFFLPTTFPFLTCIKWFAAILAFLVVLCLILEKLFAPAMYHQKVKKLKENLSYEQVFLIYLFFWYIISVALNQHFYGQYYEPFYIIQENKTWIFVTGMISFLFFPFAFYAGEERARRIIECLFKTALIPFAVLSAWILLQVFHGHYITVPSGRQFFMEESTILTLSDLNHNLLACQVMVMCGIALYMIVTQKGISRACYFVCLLVMLVFLALTNSRNYWYCTVMMLNAAAFLLCWNHYDRRKMPIRIGIGLCAVILISVALQFFREGVFGLMRMSQKYYSGEEMEAVAAVRTVQGDLGNVGNRLPLYKAGLHYMFTNRFCFLFGITPATGIIVEPLRGMYGVNETFKYGHMHNIFLQMGMAFGVPTMLAMIVFVVIQIIRGMRIIFRYRKELFPGAWMVPLLALCILASDMFEVSLNSSLKPACTVFYLMAGWVIMLERSAQRKKTGIKPDNYSQNISIDSTSE